MSEISRCDLSIKCDLQLDTCRIRVDAVESLAKLLTTTAKMQMNPLPLHELLQVLAWLEGIWITDEPGTVSYPTMKSFNYYDQINITSTGQPLLNYVAQSWHPDNGMPLHRETGFLQILPGSKKVVLSLIDNIGLFTVEQGDLVNDDNGTIELKSTNVLTTDASIPTFPTLTEVRSCVSSANLAR